MRRHIAMFTLVFGAALASAWLISPGMAEDEPDRKGPNTVEPGDAKPEGDEAAKAVKRLAAAYEMVYYGRENQSTQALLVAAEILGTTPTTDGDEELTEEGGPTEPPSEEDLQEDITAEGLIAEARAMSDASHIAELADAVRKRLAERGRGAVGGPAQLFRHIGPNGRAEWSKVFYGNEIASVTAAPCDYADLDLYVYDDNGNLITCDRSPDNVANGTWSPRYTGRFRIVVENCTPRGTSYNFINN